MWFAKKKPNSNASIRQSQSIENELVEEQRKLPEQRNTFEVVRQRSLVDNRSALLMQQMNEYQRQRQVYGEQTVLHTAIAVFYGGANFAGGSDVAAGKYGHFGCGGIVCNRHFLMSLFTISGLSAPPANISYGCRMPC